MLFVLVAVTPTLQVPIPQEQIPLGPMVITQRLKAVCAVVVSGQGHKAKAGHSLSSSQDKAGLCQAPTKQ